jgi:NADP-dependent 3-hydroxy acid dehydrogenase YdfG
MAEKIGNGTVSMKMDVTQESDWKKAVDICIEKFGRIDIVVNNAGTSYKNKVSLNY